MGHVLRNNLIRSLALLGWLYVILLGGTMAVFVAPGVRLISQGLLLAVLGGWLLILIRSGRALPATALNRPLLAFLGAAALATLLSRNPRVSVEALLLWTGYALLFYAMVTFVAADHGREVLALIVGAATIVAVATLGELAAWYFGLLPGTGYSVGWPSVAPEGMTLPPVWLRPRLVTGNPNLLAGYLAPLLPLGMAMALGGRTRAERVGGWIWTALLALALTATLSRGGGLAGVAGAASVGLLLLAQRHQAAATRWVGSRRRQVVLVSAGVLAGAAVLWRFLPGAGAEHGSAGVRVELWGYALRMVQQAPLTGLGPDNFGLGMLELRPPTASIEDFLPHAHQLYLGIAADTGLLGLGGALWLGFVVAQEWRGRMHAAPAGERWLLMGLMGSMVAIAVHGLVEDFRIFPLIVVQGIALVTLIVARPERIRTPRPAVGGAARSKVGALALAALSAVLVAATLFTSFTRWELAAGVALADGGRWEEAVHYLDRAASHDPGVKHHALQMALAHGWLAAIRNEGAAEHRAKAIEAFRAAIDEEGRYALNHANLATVLWQDDQREAATAAMARAVALHPAEPSYRLILAQFLAAQGRREEAEREHLALLVAQPQIMQRRAWQSAVGGAADQEKLVAQAWDRLASHGRVEGAVARGRLALAAGRGAEAVAQLRAAVELAPRSSEAWTNLGTALATVGDREEAKEAFRQVVALHPAGGTARAALAEMLAEDGAIGAAEQEARLALFVAGSERARLVLARLARRQGRVDEAVAHYRAALPDGGTPVFYNLTAWRRPGIQHDRLPPLVRVEATEHGTATYRELATYLVEEGRLEEAGTVFRRWLVYDPSAAEAALARQSLSW